MEKNRYLEPGDQLVLGAKVNRVGDLLPDEPATFHLLTDVQDIVRTVKDRVESSEGRHPFEHTHRKKPRRGFGIMSAATGTGNLNVSVGNEHNEENFDENPYIYRIGKYVLIRHDHGPMSEIIMFPFMHANKVAQEMASEKNQSILVTNIAYVTETCQITGIAKFEGEEPITIWEYRKPSDDVKPLRAKNLLYLNRKQEPTAV